MQKILYTNKIFEIDTMPKVIEIFFMKAQFHSCWIDKENTDFNLLNNNGFKFERNPQWKRNQLRENA